MTGIEAFADEYGQPNLNTSVDNVSTHYIVAATIVEEPRVDDLRDVLNGIRLKHFQAGPMKSSVIGDNDNRRLRVLADLRAAGLHGIALVVDKDRIRADSGLRFQRPFRRFLNNKLYEELFGTFPTLRLTADRVGRTDFMRKFTSYLETQHHLNTLFNTSAMNWASARDEVLLQAADVVAGSLGRCFDKGKESPRAEELLHAMTPWVQLREWPWPVPAPPVGDDAENDGVVRAVAIERAQRFIEKHHDSGDEDIRHQVGCIKYLAFYAQHLWHARQ